MTGNTGTRPAVLATDSEPLAIGLTALLLSIPPIKEVKCAVSLEQLMGFAADLQPALVVFDTALAGGTPFQPPADIRTVSPRTLVVILCSNMEEYRALLSNGENPVIMKGTDPGRLARILEFLLKDRVPA